MRISFILYRRTNYLGSNQCHIETTISLNESILQTRDLALVLSQFHSTFHTVAHLELELQVEERDEYLFKDWSAQWFHMEWPLLFCQFPAMQILYVSGHLKKYITFALGSITEKMVPEVFPSLHLILIEDEPRSFADMIVAARQPSGRPVIVVEDKEEF